jgi:hypothetical protein
MTSSTKTTTFLDAYNYKYKRTVFELAILLKTNKAFEEFTQSLMAFITNAQMVDPKFVINPINENSKEKNISSKVEISPKMTKLGLHIKISGYGNVFHRKIVWGNQDNERKGHKTEKDEYRNLTVYFSMVISSKVKPQEIIERVTHKWACLNGTCLQVKDLQSTESKTVVTFFKVSTLTPRDVLLAKLKKILLEAQNQALNNCQDPSTFDFTLDEGIKHGAALPPMNLPIQVALLKGAHVTAFNRIGHHAQHVRKSWHLEVDKKYAAKMKGLIQCAKEYGCFEEIWGSHTHLSKVTDSNSTARNAKRQVDVAQIHTNTCSPRSKSLSLNIE